MNRWLVRYYTNMFFGYYNDLIVTADYLVVLDGALVFYMIVPEEDPIIIQAIKPGLWISVSLVVERDKE